MLTCVPLDPLLQALLADFDLAGRRMAHEGQVVPEQPPPGQRRMGRYSLFGRQPAVGCRISASLRCRIGLCGLTRGQRGAYSRAGDLRLGYFARWLSGQLFGMAQNFVERKQPGD